MLRSLLLTLLLLATACGQEGHSVWDDAFAQEWKPSKKGNE